MSRSDVLVDADWVEAHLDDPKVVLVEVDEDTSAYDKNHIRDAVRIDWKKDLQDPVRRDFVDQAGFEALLSPARHRQRRHRGALRRQQQLVRRLRLLVLQALRPRATSGCSTAAARSGSWTPATWSTTPWPRRAADRVHRRRSRTPRSAPSATTSLAAIGSHNLVDVRSPDEFSGKLLAPAHLPQEQSQRPGHIPTRPQHPVVEGRQRRRHLQVGRRADARCTARGRRPVARTPSPTAASASAPRTPGSCCTSCSASRTSRTTTVRGPSTARWSACRSSSAPTDRDRASDPQARRPSCVVRRPAVRTWQESTWRRRRSSRVSVTRDGEPVVGYVRLLDGGGEFTAEVPTSATGQFRFFAAPGTWTRARAGARRDRGPGGRRLAGRPDRGRDRGLTTGRCDPLTDTESPCHGGGSRPYRGGVQRRRRHAGYFVMMGGCIGALRPGLGSGAASSRSRRRSACAWSRWSSRRWRRSSPTGATRRTTGGTIRAGTTPSGTTRGTTATGPTQ